MDYQTMKKSELIEECIKLKDQVTEMKHLSEAVEAKDKEIAKLKETYEAKLEKLKVEKDTDIATQTEAKTKNCKEQLAEKDAEFEKVRQGYEKHIKVLEAQLNRRIQELNKVIFQYGALLKTVQGVLDTHLEVNDMIVKEIQNEGGNK